MSNLKVEIEAEIIASAESLKRLGNDVSGAFAGQSAGAGAKNPIQDKLGLEFGKMNAMLFQMKPLFADIANNAERTATALQKQVAAMQALAGHAGTAGLAGTPGSPSGASGGSGGGQGAGQGAGALPGPPGAPPNAPSQPTPAPKPTWSITHAQAGRISSAMGVVGGAATGGYNTSDYMSGAGNLLQTFGGQYGTIANAAVQLAVKTQKEEELFRDLRRPLFQAGGNDLRGQFNQITNDLSGGGDMADMNRFGITPEALQQSMLSLARRGGAGAVSTDGMKNINGAQGMYGVGSDAVQLMGDTARMGKGGVESSNTIGTAIGVAIATNLDRGRFGESFALLSRAAAGAIHGDFDVGKAGADSEFVGSAGGAFRGDTGRAENMKNMLGRLAQGSAGPLSEVMALGAAGMGSTTDYFGAEFKIARGLDTAGGVSRQAIAENYYNNFPGVKEAWESGDEQQKQEAAVVLGKSIGMNAADVYDMLQNVRGQKGKVKSDTVSVGMAGIRGGRPPESDTQNARVRNGKMRGVFGAGSGMGDDRGTDPTGSNPMATHHGVDTVLANLGSSLDLQQTLRGGARRASAAITDGAHSIMSSAEMAKVAIAESIGGFDLNGAKITNPRMAASLGSFDGAFFNKFSSHLSALGPNSVDRTEAFRKKEWAAALRKYKDPAIARKHASQYHSRHQDGDAVDIEQAADPRYSDWIDQNSSLHGLAWPGNRLGYDKKGQRNDPVHHELVGQQQQQQRVIVDVNVHDARVSASTRVAANEKNEGNAGQVLPRLGPK